MSLFSRFSQHHPKLNDLSTSARQNISELIFSCRDGVLSVCVCFPNLMYLRTLLPSIPTEVEQATGSRFAVDLESIGTDRVRLYINGQEEGESIRGFYFDANMRMGVLKKYKRSDGPYKILIDRYDGGGALISGDEPESSSDETCWTGPQEILDAAIDAQQDHTVIFLSKGDKSQSYIRITR